MTQRPRDEFLAVISGWTLTNDVEDLGEFIESAAVFITENPGPLLYSEHLTLSLMIETQIQRGIARGDFDF